MEVGRLELHPETVDLGDVIREVADALRPLIDARAQSLVLEIPRELPRVWADRVRAIQIVTNLVSNAHKYTPDGGHIWVSARAAADDAVEISVRDDGLGLSEAEQAQVFSRFFRAESAAVQQTSGTGLGLAITQSLVTMQGGQIRVESARGQGSIFSFTLPTAPRERVRPAPSGPSSARPSSEAGGQ
jgi:signal transduction histidine kinase